MVRMTGTSVGNSLESLQPCNRPALCWTTDCVGCGFDEASAMSSERVGTAALVKSKAPLSDYFHCTMHSFNLSASQSSKIVEIRHCFDCIQEAPSPDPCPIGEGDTPPRTPPARRLRRLDTRAFGVPHLPPFENP